MIFHRKRSGKNMRKNVKKFLKKCISERKHFFLSFSIFFNSDKNLLRMWVFIFHFRDQLTEKYFNKNVFAINNLNTKFLTFQLIENDLPLAYRLYFILSFCSISCVFRIKKLKSWENSFYKL